VVENPRQFWHEETPGDEADMTAGESKESGLKRVSVRYEGRVQGVGFRYTAIEVAAGFAVTGFVRNEPDGSVTLVAEGAEKDLVALLHAVRSTHLGRYITRDMCSWSVGTGEFAGFGVKHAW